MSDNNTGGVSAEQMVAAFDGIADTVAQAYEAVREAVRIVAEKFSRIAQRIAAELEAQHELETALRWAAVYNRPLYERRQRKKKLRIRKKYEKRILAWYRAEEIAGGPRGDDGYGSTGR